MEGLSGAEGDVVAVSTGAAVVVEVVVAVVVFAPPLFRLRAVVVE